MNRRPPREHFDTPFVTQTMVARFEQFAKQSLGVIASGAAAPAVLLCVLVVLGGWLTGCRSQDCQRMLACCETIAGEPGVGKACGEMAANVRDPETCRTITRTVRYMYEQRDAEPPEVCLEPAQEER